MDTVNEHFQVSTGRVEAFWAHNPEVRGSKPRSAHFFIIKKREHIKTVFQELYFYTSSLSFLSINLRMSSCDN